MGLSSPTPHMPQTELETALANCYHQDLEKLAADLLSERDYDVEPTGTNGPDGGIDALLHDGDRVGALHVARTRSDRLREKITSDADKLLNHDTEYDFFVFVTTADPPGASRRQLESQIQEEYRWNTTIWAREQLRNALMTDHQELAQRHLNVNPDVELTDHREELRALHDDRLDNIKNRTNLPNEIPDGPVLAIHLIPNNIQSRTATRNPGTLPAPPFFSHPVLPGVGGEPLSDGIVSFNHRLREQFPNYVYLNETGWVEAVSTEYFRPNPAGAGGSSIPKSMKISREPSSVFSAASRNWK